MGTKNRYKLNPKRNLESIRINRVTIFSDDILSGKEWEQFTINKDNIEPILVHCTAKDLADKKEVVEKRVIEKDVIELSTMEEKGEREDGDKEDGDKVLKSDRNDMVDVFSKLPGIGKVSAAKIYDSGICTLGDMIKADPENISKIVGRFFTTEKAKVAIDGAKDLFRQSYTE